MENLPLVSVGIAIYNGSRYIIETLETINNQTYSNIEIVIVDDGSSDNSYDLCRSWEKKSRFQISFTKNSTNFGLPTSRNIILNKSNGKYLNLFDQDDIMAPDKIESDVRLFEEQSEDTAMIYSKPQLINEGGGFIDQDYFDRIGFKGLVSDDFFIELIKMNFIPAPTVILRTDLVKTIGGYDESLQFDDWDMWLRLSKKYKFIFADVTNVYYRLHNKSMMANRNNAQTIIRNNANIKMFQKHLGDNQRHDEALFKKLAQLSIYSYYLSDKNAGKVMHAYLEKKFDLKVWLYHALFVLGISHPSKLLKSRK